MKEERDLIDDLDELARLKPDADASRRAVDRVRAALTDLPVSGPKTRLESIMSKRNFAAAAIVLLAVTFFSHRLVPPGSTSGLAFAEVQGQVEKTRSVQYVQTRKDRDKENRNRPEEMRKVMILGSHRKREEVKITTAGDPLPDGARWSYSPNEWIDIYDARTGKMIFLYPEKRDYVVPRASLSIDEDGHVKEDKIDATPRPEFDFYKSIREVPSENAKQLPDQQIGEQKAAGFQVVEKIEKPHGTDTWTRTYWVDPKSKLPLRIETAFRSTNPMMGDSDWVLSDIIFDAPLDEALFSTEPPKGYKDLAAEAEKAEADKNSEKPNNGEAN